MKTFTEFKQYLTEPFEQTMFQLIGRRLESGQIGMNRAEVELAASTIILSPLYLAQEKLIEAYEKIRDSDQEKAS